MTFEELRKKYNKFVYERYEINDEGDWRNITYFFTIEGLSTFTPSIKIDKKNIKNKNIGNDFLNYLVFHIGLVELISYWKCCCPKNVEIKAGYIDEDQIKWFKKMYFYGLGEFFYTNGIDVDEDGFMEIKSSPSPFLEKEGDVSLAFSNDRVMDDFNYKYLSVKGNVDKFDFQANSEYIKKEHFITNGSLPYHKEAREKAKLLRNSQTSSEEKLRDKILKNLDININRQKPIDHFIADFYIPSSKLIIEMDGGIHETQVEYDERRDELLSMYGIVVARIKNVDLDNHFDEIKAELLDLIDITRKEKNKLDTETKSSPSPFLEKEGDVSRNKFPLFFEEGVRGGFNGTGNLITIGGGKDSCVSLELLKGMDNDTFILNPNDVTLECSKIAGYDNPRIMKRILDPQIIELNKQGFLNGHTPFNALLAFLTYLVAYLGNKKYIVLSNESSANESNVRGLKVNHQYSKSFEFENDFNQYTEKYFGIGIKYFSFLRPLLEIQIAKLFSEFEQYHQVFKSCNVGSKSKPRKWCCNCPKCLFVYIILSPFLYKEKLINIFGEDLFENKNLLQTFIDLTGNSDNKPFECVGTYDEVNYAIALVIKKLNGYLPYLLQYYVDHFELKDYDLLNYFNEENNLDPKFLEILKKYL